MDFKIKLYDLFKHNETDERVKITRISFHHVRVEGLTINKTFGFSEFKRQFTFVRRG